MSDSSSPATKADLLARIDSGWTRLHAYIDSLTEQQLSGPTDAAGWTAKDHLAHLAAWERSMVYLLQGLPRHEGLGVEESIYLECGFDEINAAIQDASKDLSLTDVRGVLNSTHEQLRGIVAGIAEEEFGQPYSHFLPDEPGRDDGEPIIGRISGNTYRHYNEHIPYIERIVATA